MLLPKEVELGIIRIRKIEEAIDGLKQRIENENITWQQDKKLQFILSEYRILRDEKKRIEKLIRDIIKLINSGKSS